MTKIIKRSREASSQDLVKAVEQFCLLLQDQNEHEAISDLRAASEALRKAQDQAEGQVAAARRIVECFEGEHELIAYTMQRDSGAGQWTEVEELSNLSSRVLSLARRIVR